MVESTQLSEAKRLLLEKYLRGDLPRKTAASTTIPRRSLEVPAPLSFAQQQMWLHEQLVENTPIYNESMVLHFSGVLNVPALKQSLNEVIQRHEIWRTSFPLVDGQPVQMVHPHFELALPVVDLRHLAPAQRETEALRLATEQVQSPFDLTTLPLLRATLMQSGDEDHHLFLALHHMILDGTLYEIFLPELHTLYEAFSNGKPSPLAPLPVQYADFAVWQRERLQPHTLTEQLAYWKKQLANAPATLELSVDRPSPQIQSYRGAKLAFTLSKEVSDNLKALSRREGVTLYMTLQAAFQILLYRYTGQSDMLIGTTSTARKPREIQGLIGLFLNTLVLCANLEGNPTFRELLGRVREVVLDAHGHPDLPFEYLVKELQPERNVGETPLVRVMFSLEAPLPVLPAGWTVSQTEVHTNTAKFDLSIAHDDRPEGLTGWLEYSTDLFDEATIKRMIGYWQTLLEGITRAPEQRVARLPFLTEEEQRLLLVEWNNTSVLYPDDKSVHQLFEEQVERTPGAIALYFKDQERDQELTYRDLNAQANRLAHHLRQLGVDTAARVGICMERSMKMVIGILGILKAGGTYVPIDPSYPSTRQEFMLQDAQVKVLLTSEQFANLFSLQDLQVVCLDTDWQPISQQSSQNLICEATGDNLAYIMYTSGSTGMPKGVEIRHRSIARLVFGVEYAHLDATQKFLHMAPISFDASTFELWGALLHGASCVLFPDLLPTPRALASIISKHNVTIVWLTASLFNMVIDEAPEALRGVQQVLTGGEALSVAHVRRALALLPSTQIINGYGPTECTTFACCYPIPRQIGEDARSIPIGRPISNTEAYILDASLNPVPVGVTGELYLGGDGLARGYLNRPELTREKFIPHPFRKSKSKTPETYLYKTGDLVRYLADGTIEFIGRIDHQVKLRGFRVEPGEVEVALGSHPGVREAIVIVHKDRRGEKSLVSYVTVRQGLDVSFDELRQYLQERLPAYMIPSAFVLLDALPLTPNGKVDRNALPDPEAIYAATSDSVVAPKSMEQQVLLQIWEDLLEAWPIGINDNFFLLGGNSLLATRLVHRIELAFQKKVPLSKLIVNPTIESLADALYEGNDVSRVPIVTIQQGSKFKTPFFFLHGDPDGGPFYCFTLAQSLGTEQPFYACAPYRFVVDEPLPTFEAMASAHLAAIRAIQPEGPYLLGGFCNGALVAYEMAHQLLAANQKVDLLFLVDPAPPAHRKWTRDAVALLSRPFKLRQEQQLDWFLRLHHIYRYLRFGFVRRQYHERMAASTHRSNRFSILKFLVPPVSVLHEDWLELYRWLMAAYVPVSYPDKVTFVWTEEDMSTDGRWKRTAEAQRGETHIFHSGHLNWVSEHLDVLAGLLRTSLLKIQKVGNDITSEASSPEGEIARFPGVRKEKV